MGHGGGLRPSSRRNDPPQVIHVRRTYANIPFIQKHGHGDTRRSSVQPGRGFQACLADGSTVRCQSVTFRSQCYANSTSNDTQANFGECSGRFAYDGRTFPNLSEVASLITGVKWNGPRFFGLRTKAAETVDSEPDRPRKARRASVLPRSNHGSGRIVPAPKGAKPGLTNVHPCGHHRPSAGLPGVVDVAANGPHPERRHGSCVG